MWTFSGKTCRNESNVENKFLIYIDNNPSAVAGKTYVFESYAIDGEDQTDAMLEMYSSISLAFDEDGVCVQTTVWSDAYAEMLGSDPVEMSGTYEEDSDTVTVTFESDEGDTVMTFTVDGDTLVMEEDDETTTYIVEE